MGRILIRTQADGRHDGVSKLCRALGMFFFCLLLCDSSFAGNGEQNPYGPTDAESPPQFNHLRIATPSWENQTNSDGTGLFFDLLHAVYDPTGIALWVSFVPIRRACLMLQEQTVDASTGFYSAAVGKSLHRDFYQTPRSPIVTERFCAIFKKDSGRSWQYPTSLANSRVSWVAGYELSKRLPVPVHYQNVSSQVQAWKLLQLDRIDYYIDSESDSMAAARKLGLNLQEYQVETLWIDKMYIPFALTPQGTYFMQVFDQRMQQLRQSGALARLYGKWGVPLPPQE